MKAKQILFNSLMVKALLDGRKTQTRRPINPQPELDPSVGFKWKGAAYGKGINPSTEMQQAASFLSEYNPLGQPGDLLYVRESCWIYGSWWEAGKTKTGRQKWRFKPIGKDVVFQNPGVEHMTFQGVNLAGYVPRNSIHMPRWASRLTLKISEIRVERIQEISEDDALTEGIETDLWDMAPVAKRYGYDNAWFVGWSMGIEHPNVEADAGRVCRESYRSLWDSINAKNGLGWDSNPWVWVVVFEVIHANVDPEGLGFEPGDILTPGPNFYRSVGWRQLQ